MKHFAAKQRTKTIIFAAGDKYLSFLDLIQYKFLPSLIQFTENIV